MAQWHAQLTHCPQGHRYVKQNTYLTPAGVRQCRKCSRNRQKNRKANRVANGLCPCGKTRDPRSKRSCTNCLLYYRKRKRALLDIAPRNWRKKEA